jgi:hypothetical protein
VDTVTKDPKQPSRSKKQHAWTPVALGRVCSVCGLVQANGEFDDAAPCSGRRP